MLIPTPLIQRIVRTILGWLDSRAEAPIMQRHVNAGSDLYFSNAERTKGESELDEVLGGRASEDDDDEPSSDDEMLEAEYSATRARAAWAAVLLPVSTIYLIRFWRLGPLRDTLGGVGWRHTPLLVSAALVCAVSAITLVRLGIRANRMRRELAALRRKSDMPRDPGGRAVYPRVAADERR